MTMIREADLPPGHFLAARRPRDGETWGVARPLTGTAKIEAALARLKATDAWAARIAEDRSIMPRDRLLYRRTLRDILDDPSIPWPEEPAPWDDRRLVGKWLIIQRLEAAGLYGAAQAILDHPDNTEARERWYRPGWDNVFYNDPALLAVLTAIGADIEATTAP